MTVTHPTKSQLQGVINRRLGKVKRKYVAVNMSERAHLLAHRLMSHYTTNRNRIIETGIELLAAQTWPSGTQTREFQEEAPPNEGSPEEPLRETPGNPDSDKPYEK